VGVGSSLGRRTRPELSRRTRGLLEAAAARCPDLPAPPGLRVARQCRTLPSPWRLVPLAPAESCFSECEALYSEEHLGTPETVKMTVEGSPGASTAVAALGG